MDVQRYLADEPVQACPPSMGYRLRKFARRNKAGLAVAAMVLSFLVLLGSGMGWAVRDRQAREADIARERSERQQRLTAQVELILVEADRLEREQKWPEALAAARRAEAAVFGDEADAATAQRVRELLKDVELIDRVEQIRMESATIVDGKLNIARLDREYARAFREYGVDVEALAAETSIACLKARPTLAMPLAAALDNWVFCRRTFSQTDAAGWKRLVAVARGIDPEPLRDRLRSTWGQAISEVQDDLRRLADSIDIRAQHPATLVTLAETLQRVKHSDSALRLLRDAQYVYPGDFWLTFNLGSALDQPKDCEERIRFYTAAVSIRPQSSPPHNNLGIALLNQHRLDEAVAAYRKAIEHDPKFAKPYYNLGIALLAQKKPDEAIAAYRKAIEHDPKYAQAYYNLGNALFDRKKLVEAIAAYRKAVELIELDPKHALDPSPADAYYNLGVALFDRKKLDEAIAAYRKAIELNPKHFNA
jgi:Tfp pilus assembly protein PilF